MKRRTRRGDPQKQGYWEEAVRRWKEGGQSVAAFCRDEGLRESSFYYWRRELAIGGGRSGERAPEVRKGARLQARPATPALRSSRQNCPPSFLPVHVAAPADGYPAGGRPGGARAAFAVEIVLAHGRTVRVGAGFDRQTLAEVLAVLEARPC